MTEVAKTYGGALFDLSLEDGSSEQMLEEVTALAQAFGENPDFIKLLSTPTVRKEERLNILEQSFRGKVQDHVLNFMKILTEHGTIGEFAGCAAEFRSRYNKENHIEEVTAVTAVPLSEELCQKLKAKLEALTGMTVVLTNRVDKTILGGVRLEMDGTQYEGSVAHQLAALRRQLSETML